MGGHQDEYCRHAATEASALLLVSTVAKVDNLEEAYTCSFTVDGPKGGSCNIPGVKAPCCDVLHAITECVNHNQGSEEGAKMCVNFQKDRIIADAKAAGGKCPGLEAAKGHQDEYCRHAATEASALLLVSTVAKVDNLEEADTCSFTVDGPKGGS